MKWLKNIPGKAWDKLYAIKQTVSNKPDFHRPQPQLSAGKFFLVIPYKRRDSGYFRRIIPRPFRFSSFELIVNLALRARKV